MHLALTARCVHCPMRLFNRSLVEKNFTLLHMRDDLVGIPLLGTAFHGQLPMLEEITLENLQYDVKDAEQVRLRPNCLKKQHCHAPILMHLQLGASGAISG